MPENRHAYLIIAHNNFNQLKLLLELLDDSRNDIFLHIGKDVHNVDLSQFTSICKSSPLYLANKRMIGYWGGKSLVDITLLLLKQVLETSDYAYYHLLSGVDLPIKTQDYIHDFFEKNNGKEFVGFDPAYLTDKEYRENTISRVRYHHLFTYLYLLRKYGGLLSRGSGFIHTYLDGASVIIQRLFGVDRISKLNLEIYKGAQWFSITQNFAKYLVGKQLQIEKLVKHSFCADEIFVQTIIMNSPFQESLSSNTTEGTMRHIDWKRGGPYTFRYADLDELMQSDKLFARKFDERVDMKIIEEIYNRLKRR